MTAIRPISVFLSHRYAERGAEIGLFLELKEELFFALHGLRGDNADVRRSN